MPIELMKFQFDGLSDYDLRVILRFDEALSEKFEAYRNHNGSGVQSVAFSEMTVNEIGLALDHLSALQVQYNILVRKVKELEHFKNTSTGLWATDKDPGSLLKMFWQRSSDACPVESDTEEEQEEQFKEWVGKLFFQIK